MDLDPYVLQEIAGQQPFGGALANTIRTLVDARQKIALSDAELATALNRLVNRGFIVNSEGHYRLSESMAAQVPKTANGELSMDWRDWDRLSRSLGFGR